MKLRGALFDMDGTVVEVPYDWPRIRADIGAHEISILTYISGLPEPEKSRKWAILQSFEDDATRRAVLKRGMRNFLNFLEAYAVRTALVTNNSQKNVDALLDRFRLKFDCVLSRESGLWKPSGEPLRAAMHILKLAADVCCAIGDSHFDIRAAQEADVARIFILSKDRSKFASGSYAPWLATGNRSRGFQGGVAPLVAGRGFIPRPRRGGRAAGSSRRPLEGVFPSKLTSWPVEIFGTVAALQRRFADLL
jgi:HAD superfamily hydrolase (TIGR01509 family)